MKEILNELIEHRSLSKEAAHRVLIDLASGKYNASQMSAFMTVYMMRAITIEELRGFRDAMLELCISVESGLPVMDVCGTGGDGSRRALRCNGGSAPRRGFDEYPQTL